MSRHVKGHLELSTPDVIAARVQLMAAEYKSRVGNRIRAAREAKGWTQSRLARELPESIDGPSVSRWENAKVAPGPDYLEALAAALDVDLSYFLAPEPAEGAPDLLGALGTGGEAQQLDRLEHALVDVRVLLLNLHEQLGLALPGEPESDEHPGDAIERELREGAERAERLAGGSAESVPAPRRATRAR